MLKKITEEIENSIFLNFNYKKFPTIKMFHLMILLYFFYQKNVQVYHFLITLRKWEIRFDIITTSFLTTSNNYCIFKTYDIIIFQFILIFRSYTFWIRCFDVDFYQEWKPNIVL